LFRNGSDALDLASLNIQRGRDHGLNYCSARAALGLFVPTTFEDAKNAGLFTDATIDLLKETYEYVLFSTF